MARLSEQHYKDNLTTPRPDGKMQRIRDVFRSRSSGHSSSPANNQSSPTSLLQSPSSASLSPLVLNKTLPMIPGDGSPKLKRRSGNVGHLRSDRLSTDRSELEGFDTESEPVHTQRDSKDSQDTPGPVVPPKRMPITMDEVVDPVEKRGDTKPATGMPVINTSLPSDRLVSIRQIRLLCYDRFLIVHADEDCSTTRKSHVKN